jgi:hypothetical protein
VVRVEGPRRWRDCSDRIQVEEEGPPIFSGAADGCSQVFQWSCRWRQPEFSGAAGGGSQIQ